MTALRTKAARVAGSAFAVGALAIGALVAAPPAAAYWRRPPLSYTLAGDVTGSAFEGIGVDERSGSLYVSEGSGGEIHRGYLDSPITQELLSGDGIDGRWSAAGITVDTFGRIYIAGGTNSSQNIPAHRICGCTPPPEGCWQR